MLIIEIKFLIYFLYFLYNSIMAIEIIPTAIFVLLYVTQNAYCISTNGNWQNSDPATAIVDVPTSVVTEPRAYSPDASALDFVYHDYDEMTRFLRYVFSWFLSLKVFKIPINLFLEQQVQHIQI